MVISLEIRLTTLGTGPGGSPWLSAILMLDSPDCPEEWGDEVTYTREHRVHTDMHRTSFTEDRHQGDPLGCLDRRHCPGHWSIHLHSLHHAQGYPQAHCPRARCIGNRGTTSHNLNKACPSNFNNRFPNFFSRLQVLST